MSLFLLFGGRDFPVAEDVFAACPCVGGLSSSRRRGRVALRFGGGVGGLHAVGAPLVVGMDFVSRFAVFVSVFPARAIDIRVRAFGQPDLRGLHVACFHAVVIDVCGKSRHGKEHGRHRRFSVVFPLLSCGRAGRRGGGVPIFRTSREVAFEKAAVGLTGCRCREQGRRASMVRYSEQTGMILA